MVRTMAVIQTSNNLVVNRIVVPDDSSPTIADHTLVEETDATGEACIAGTWNGSVFVPTLYSQRIIDLANERREEDDGE